MNDRGIPQKFHVNTKPGEYHSIFGYTDRMTVASHVVRKNEQ